MLRVCNFFHSRIELSNSSYIAFNILALEYMTLWRTSFNRIRYFYCVRDCHTLFSCCSVVLYLFSPWKEPVGLFKDVYVVEYRVIYRAFTSVLIGRYLYIFMGRTMGWKHILLLFFSVSVRKIRCPNIWNWCWSERRIRNETGSHGSEICCSAGGGTQE